MHEFIVVGPIDGLFHLAYRIAGTKTYSSVVQFTDEHAAHDERRLMNESLNVEQRPT